MGYSGFIALVIVAGGVEVGVAVIMMAVVLLRRHALTSNLTSMAQSDPEQYRALAGIQAQIDRGRHF